MWLPHAIYMTTANITDRSGAINMVKYCCDVKKIYTKFGKIRSMAAIPDKILRMKFGGILRAEVEVVKRNELYTFSVFQKRWIVECTFCWLYKYRRLWKNCERFLQNSFRMIALAFIRIIFRRY